MTLLFCFNSCFNSSASSSNFLSLLQTASFSSSKRTLSDLWQCPLKTKLQITLCSFGSLSIRNSNAAPSCPSSVSTSFRVDFDLFELETSPLTSFLLSFRGTVHGKRVGRYVRLNFWPPFQCSEQIRVF